MKYPCNQCDYQATQQGNLKKHHKHHISADEAPCPLSIWLHMNAKNVEYFGMMSAEEIMISHNLIFPQRSHQIFISISAQCVTFSALFPRIVDAVRDLE